MTKNELRRLEEKIRNIIMKSDRAGSKGNPLHWKMRYVEDVIEDTPVYGLLFQFDFPYKKVGHIIGKNPKMMCPTNFFAYLLSRKFQKS